jgi:hypothetical protein
LKGDHLVAFLVLVPYPFFKGFGPVYQVPSPFFKGKAEDGVILLALQEIKEI